MLTSRACVRGTEAESHPTVPCTHPICAALVLSSSAVAAMIMAAWATWKAQDLSNQLNSRATPTTSASTVALVQNPAQVD